MSEERDSLEGTESTEFVEPRAPESPTRIGPYRLIQKLGEGGMGEVWEAEQEGPVRRKVALKLIKWGMDTKRVIARFEAERQALALMNHPNVAKVFDAGATERGRPYFAMELVKGEPINVHCDRQRLTTRERLELFTKVCEGVQHAHQKGIIHRDIKPTNVLVQLQGEERVPKIIDFGVAKATDQRLTERTVFTEMGQLIGTPEYMSPEQAEMTIEDIDTRTDVYSLGVMLYELLVGRLPFDPKELRRAGFDEIRRRIREEEPSKPSTRFTTHGEAATGSAKNRRTDPASLLRQLRGDLDCITMKALEKDRTRRYDSPTELAGDIRRHLENQPVTASAPTLAYRMGKFVRRHRLGVAVAAFVMLVVVGFAARERIQSRRIAEERDRANREAQTAEQVSEFLVGLFQVSDPGKALGNTITAREILDAGSEKVERDLAGQPEVQASMMTTISHVYFNLGLYPQAESLLERALQVRKDHSGEDDAATLTIMGDLAVVLKKQSRLEEAERLYRTALDRQRRTLGDEDPRTLNTCNNLALLLHDQGKVDEAEDLMRETLDMHRRVHGADHIETASVMKNLAFILATKDEADEAEQLLGQALEVMKRTPGPEDPMTLSAMNNYAALLVTRGKLEEAEGIRRELIRTQKRILGETHPDTLISLNNLAFLLKKAGRLEESEVLFREVAEKTADTLGPEHRHTLMTMVSLGQVQRAQGKTAEAEQTLLGALDAYRSGGLEDEILYGVLEREYGLSLMLQGRYAEAEDHLMTGLDTLNASLGPEHGRTRSAARAVAQLYEEWGRPELAAKYAALTE